MTTQSWSYREALQWLFGTQLFGIKLGLENIERLLQELRVPPPQQRIIHVAGTNGKGSVCAMAAAICRAAGYRTGLFTSPHLVTFRERIQVNGELISHAEVAAGLAKIRKVVATWDPHPTFFEITTTLALGYFTAENCDVVVLETGMGGRLDATNAVLPVVSVITPIDFDHQKWLGNTLPEIAAEKAGIIKPRVPVVSARQCPEAEAVIRARAAECGAPLEFITSEQSCFVTNLAGAHQQQNAALAVAALRAGRIDADENAIAVGLSNVNWPARFQRWNERTVIDGAHNVAGAHVLVDTWKAQFPGERAVVVMAILRDKDAAAFVSVIREIASRVILPAARSERAWGPKELGEVFAKVAPELPVTTAGSLTEALTVESQRDQRLLITGSLHFAGEALATLSGNPDELEDCLQ